MRIVLVAQDAVAFERHGGVAAVISAVEARSGSAYDPDVAAALTDRAAFIFEGVIANSEVCKNGGWRSLHGPGGIGFHNQGECIQFVNNGK